MADSGLNCKVCGEPLTYNEMTDPDGLELECPVCDDKPEPEGDFIFDECFGRKRKPGDPPPLPAGDFDTYQFPIIKQPFPLTGFGCDEME